LDDLGERMNRKVSFFGAIVIAIFLANSSSRAEELWVVRPVQGGMSSLSSLDGVRVYAALKDACLVGSTEVRLLDLQADGAFEVVKDVGTLDAGRDYFLFRIRAQDLDRLGPGVEVVYFDDGEAMARIERGKGFDPESYRLIDGLTRVSFTPGPRHPRREGHPRREIRVDPGVGEIVAQVSESRFTGYIQRLQDFVTRFTSTDSCRAAEEWAAGEFAEMGLESELFPYSNNWSTWYNPIGRKIGTLYPDSIYMIVGHIDATSEDPLASAPGAEDNGSGSACVLEAARVLSQHDFDCTIEFVLVSGEELGLIGSEAYARFCYNEGRRIAGVLNFDMISYTGSGGWDTNIYADRNSPLESALADLLAQLTDDYSSAYSVRVGTDGPFFGSDHYYFSFYGFPAIFSIDAQLWGAPDFYPWYHSTGDRIERLDLDFGTEVVRGAVAALATLANLSVPPLLEFAYPEGTPEMIDPDGGTEFQVEVAEGTATPEPGTGLLHTSTGAGFSTVPMNPLGPGSYEAVFPAFDCGEEVSFFVSVETTEGTVVTDPPGAPASAYSAASAYRHGVIFSDDFSMNSGWTGLGGPGEWSIGPAAGGRGEDFYGSRDPLTDQSPTFDNRVLGTDLTTEDGDYEARIQTAQWLTSPVIDCSDFFGVALNFQRWLGIGGQGRDDALIQAYDGDSWVAVFENPPMTLDDAAWRQVTHDLSSEADGNPVFRLRFGLGRTNWGFEYCGWNIDDLEVSGYSCLPPAGLDIRLIPDEDPIIVLPGGSFGLTGIIANRDSVMTATDIWLGAYAGSRWFQQELYRDVPLDMGETIQAHITQDVPQNTPPGDYLYVGYCGDYETWTVADSSVFNVTVIPLSIPLDSPSID